MILLNQKQQQKLTWPSGPSPLTVNTLSPQKAGPNLVTVQQVPAYPALAQKVATLPFNQQGKLLLHSHSGVSTY